MEMFTDSADQVVSGSNVSTVHRLSLQSSDQAVEEDNSSVIPVKEYTLSNITVTSIAALLGGLAASILVPLLLIAAGIIIWAVRRKK